jgi:hypothetical protein
MEGDKKMNFNKLFNFYNQTLFNGVLIEPRIKLFKSKHYLGLFEGYEDENGFMFMDIYLEKRAEKHSTLLHEMVHLYQYQFMHKVNHKGLFKAWRRRIKKLTGIDIK